MSNMVRRSIESKIIDRLTSVGLMFRVFSRSKSTAGIGAKIKNKGYKFGGAMLQDAIGVRVALYFDDDVALVKTILRNLFNCREGDSQEDSPNPDSFSAVRDNLIFDIPDDQLAVFKSAYVQEPIDSTFEVQIRTILSEGWHEVDHDMRYKNKCLWQADPALERALNALLATLWTCDRALREVIEDLSWRRYKAGDAAGAMLLKFRLRFSDATLREDMAEWLGQDDRRLRTLFRSDRSKLLRILADCDDCPPITVTNILIVVSVLQRQLTIESECVGDVLRSFLLPLIDRSVDLTDC